MTSDLLARSSSALPDDGSATQPLVVTADEQLLDELLRLCAAAGVTPFVAADVGSARRAWAGAPLVVVGDDVSESMVASGPVRRPGVVLVTADSSDTGVWARAVALGADQVHAVPDEQDAVIESLANCLDSRGLDAAVVTVVGGCGGAGASCLAGALALVAARDARTVLLVDADPLGGGIDMVLGNESVNGLRWPDLAATEGRISGHSLRRALPMVGGLSMLSWDRGDLLTIPPESMQSVLAAARRSHELIVVDVPRRFDDAAQEALVRSSTTLLVVPADVRAIAAATRLLGRLRDLASDIRLVVRGPGPSGLDADVVGDTLALPVAARMRPDQRLARSIDEGLGPSLGRRSPIASAARTMLAEILGRHP